MIKPEDIQIGDFLYNHRDWKCPVLSIRKEYDSDKYFIMVNARHYGEEEFRLEDLRPIPLTNEILLKNGFKKDTEGEECWLNKIAMFTPNECDDNILKKSWNCHINGLLNSFDGVIEYVHELQHALRLCKININLKI